MYVRNYVKILAQVYRLIRPLVKWINMIREVMISINFQVGVQLLQTKNSPEQVYFWYVEEEHILGILVKFLLISHVRFLRY